MTGRVTGRRAISIIGGTFPLVFAFYAYRLHGMTDYINDYGPLQRSLLYLVMAGVLAWAGLAIDVLWRNKSGRAGAAAIGFTWLMPVAAIFLTVGFASYILVPKYTGGGDVPPQLILLDTPAGRSVPNLAVSFYTAAASKNTLLWGEADGRLKAVTERSAVRKHWFELAGLKPDTQYMYTLNDSPAVRFRTPPAAGETFWFAAAGDAHVGNKTSDPAATERILKSISKPTNGYSLFFDLGDTAQLGFDNGMWQTAGATFSPYTDSIPTAYVAGNHDTMLGGLDLYQRYLGVPSSDGEEAPLWRRIDCSGVHFILLDLEWELGTYVPAQKAWLEAQLKSIPQRDWTIVLCHTFFYASGGQEDGWPWYDNKSVIAELTPLFKKYDVDLVISGHKHQAEILQNDGVTYVVAGTLGGRPDTILTYKSPASHWLKQGALGFADVTIQGSSATVAFRGADDKVLFRTTIAK